MKRTKKVIITAAALLFIEAVFGNGFSAAAEAKTKELMNPPIVLVKIRTGSTVGYENITQQPLNLGKPGFKYNTIDSKVPLIIKNDVRVTSKDISLSNTIIEGNLFISSANITMNNIKVSGNISVDPGKSGFVILNNVKAKEINVLSGGDQGIYLNKVNSDTLNINSTNKVKIEATYTTNIGVTTINTSTVFKSQFGTGGNVIVAGKDNNSKNIEVELKGNFRQVKASKEAKVTVQSFVENQDKLFATANSNSSSQTVTGLLEQSKLLERLKNENLTAQKKLITGVKGNMVQPTIEAEVEVIAIKEYDDKLLIVNKERSLPSNWMPRDLVQVSVPYRGRPEARYMRKEAADALARLFTKAKKDNINIIAMSGFRSYELQKNIYNNNVAQNGYARASMESAYPGKSEHQTGLAMDISSPSVGYSLKQSFGNTREGKWLKENAAEFGFIIRYPQGKETITGYIYEPWHIRYVGREVAVEIMRRGITLEEYFGLIK